MIGVLIKTENLETLTHKGEYHVKVKAEIGVVLLQAEESQRRTSQPPAAGRAAWDRSPSRPQKEPTLPTH